MPCLHPLPAWQTSEGEITLAKQPADGSQLQLPCGNCLGCRGAHAQAWALRCKLELQQHAHAVFTTLTYSNDNLPPTLQKRHLQLYLKRLRRSTDRAIRFFASGEYGETTDRPHYHAILYGLNTTDTNTIETSWGYGHTRTYPISPRAINYVAGYTSKKIGYKKETVRVRLDPTGTNLYHWQEPFIQMSRKPGIGHNAKQWADSWRLYAVNNGYKQAVPRYLHEAWKQQATTEEKEALLYEKYKLSLTRHITKEQLEAQELILIQKQKEASRNRKY